jgi:DNA/RNA-binding domain of Phe-tRNA-synthetase-like protein
MKFMKYSVSPWVFEKIPEVNFGIIVARGLKNTPSTEEDEGALRAGETHIREMIPLEDLKTHPKVKIYRDALSRVAINPNKFQNSVEAMTKRVLKGGNLPLINALVDRCNSVSLKRVISLGGHDLKDIHGDLSVRLSLEGDRYLPFGEEAFEPVPPGELVFISGNEVQTRQWLWRQSELGKMTLETTDVFFQLVGFEGDHHEDFLMAIKEVEDLVVQRFGGTSQTFLVNREKPSIEFQEGVPCSDQ